MANAPFVSPLSNILAISWQYKEPLGEVIKRYNDLEAQPLGAYVRDVIGLLVSIKREEKALNRAQRRMKGRRGRR